MISVRPGLPSIRYRWETPAQATRFHRHLVNAYIRGDAQETPLRPGQLQVAIVGAGATGTELAAELHRTTREIVAYGLDRSQNTKSSFALALAWWSFVGRLPHKHGSGREALTS